MENKDSLDFYVVNFFATPLTNYTEMIELQSKENVPQTPDDNETVL